MKRSIILIIIGSMIGACSLAVNDSPRTTPPGKFKYGTNIASYIFTSSGENSYPSQSYSYDLYMRYGLSEDMDVAVRMAGYGTGVEIKMAFSPYTALALGMNLYSMGETAYDSYMTLIYGFDSTGSTPYIYFKPHFQNFKLVADQYAITPYIENTIAIQVGFGFHGNPEKKYQPSIEMGFYYQFSDKPFQTVFLSIGISQMVGD